MTAGNLGRIERLNYILGGLLVIGAVLVTRSRPVALGVAVGVALTCLNFFLLKRLVTKWTSAAAANQPTSGSALLMLPKMMLLMALVVLSLAFLPIDAAAFALGFSVFVISIFVEIILSAVLPSPPPASDPENDPENANG